MTALPFPPPQLMNRVGFISDGPDLEQLYAEVGRQLADVVGRTVAPYLDLSSSAILDLGCGAGRVLRHFVDLAASGAKVCGVDIDEPSVEWAATNLGPSINVQLGTEIPPLSYSDDSFDLVYALSLFTHLDRYWAEWLAEVGRLLGPGGLALITILDLETVPEVLQGEQATGDEGMLVFGPGRSWEAGGPVVFHSPWWLREHFGRGFEFLVFDGRPMLDTGARMTQSILLLRKTSSVSAAELRRIDPDPREITGLVRQADYLADQLRRAGL